ncbi:hypothetical protein [Haloferula sargassicola]|uniref:Uncharacterized protein n=1 Tax=Haloferula sargassicola TaxID=490096 RepID=A0ABP9UQV0_9BACT
MSFVFRITAAIVALPAAVSAQVVFAAPSTGGGIGLFEQRGAQIVPLVTGQSEHYYPWISRSGRYISFSAPDPTTLGSNPSSDVYVYDRNTGINHRVINHSTAVDGFGGFISQRAISSAVSPDATLLAYGVVIQGSAQGATSAGRALNVVSLSTGLSAGPGFGVKETPSDSLQAEFVGISWDPGGNSFVTPTYVTVSPPSPVVPQLPGIVRWIRQGNGSWAGVPLSAPQVTNGGFGAIFHIYPAISPSGAGLAYFSIHYPDLFGSSLPAQVSLVRANADGSNPVVLGTFTPSGGGDTYYPAGLDWSADGSRLVFSICQQVFTGSGWTTAPNFLTAQTSSVNSSTGQDFRSEPGLAGAFGVSVGPINSFTPAQPPALQMSPDGSGNFVLRATGIDPSATYHLRSSPSLQAGSFGNPQSFTGQQLMNGITVPKSGERRFFQLFDP